MTGEGLLLRLDVTGRPRTKGSMKPQMSRGKGGALRVHLVESGEYAVPWKKTMIRAITRERLRGSQSAPHAGPVQVHATFRFERQRGVRGAVWPSHEMPYPTAIDIGDIDKLLRNLLDALTQSRLLADDSQVAHLSSIKRWCAEGEKPGVLFEVRTL